MTIFYKSDYSENAILKNLWLECFDEMPEAVDLLFDSLNSITDIYCAKSDGIISAAVYLVQSSLNGKKAHYLCGAATKKDYRGKGIMSGLIEYALNEEKQFGCSFSLLFPASDRLYGFYDRLGYSALCFAQHSEYNRAELEHFAACNDVSSEDYKELQIKCFKENFLLQNNKFIEFAKSYYKIYGEKVIDSNGCFAIIDDDGCHAEVIYAAYSDFSILCGRLLEASFAEKFVITGKVKSNSGREKYGLIKSLDESEIPENIYIGITLS